MFCRMQQLAKELGVVIPVSFFEEANNAHYNSVAIIDADGKDLGIYRKSHIPDGTGMLHLAYQLTLDLICSSIIMNSSSHQVTRRSFTLILETPALRWVFN